MRQLKLFCSPTSGAFSSNGSTGQTSLAQVFCFSTSALSITNMSCLLAGFGPPIPPPMTEEEKAVASARRLEDPPKCHCGEQAVINPRNEEDFICPLRREVSFDSTFKCQFVYVCSNVLFL